MTSTQSTSAAALVAEGHAKLQAGHLREAEDFYRRALALDPGQPEALAFLGMMAGQAGQLPTAIEFFERALKRAPRNADIHHNLGETWRNLDEPLKALRCYERATICNPRHIEAYRCAAEAALIEARRREAAGRWGDAAGFKQRAVRFWIAGAKLLIGSGNQNGAAELLKRATEIDPQCAEAWALYGSTLVGFYPSRAVVALRRAIELDPAKPWVHGLLCNALTYLRRDDEAQIAWQATRTAPNFFDSWITLTQFE
ncbi:MAG: tetratricopeptide repeat protein, partial [Alphaproteobacteria bacterium]|nr:tetratricopeptide repeat protein [Alphaproteobacteria bacterium]